MDALADLIAATRLGSVIFEQSQFVAPWGVYFGNQEHAGFHVILEGSCWLRCEGELIQLEAGDFVLLSAGSAHELFDHPESPTIPFEEEMLRSTQEVQAGPGVMRMLCGAYRFDSDMPHPVFSRLPSLILLRGDALAGHLALKMLLELLQEESSTPDRPGSQALLERLTDAIFIYIIRYWLESEDKSMCRGWMGALMDPGLSRVVASIHAHPQRQWDLELMAREAHMSRAHFARRFRESVGESPMRYVQRWRLQQARLLMRNRELSLSEIADSTGYANAFSLSKAFKKTFGHAPQRYRQTQINLKD